MNRHTVRQVPTPRYIFLFGFSIQLSLGRVTGKLKKLICQLTVSPTAIPSSPSSNDRVAIDFLECGEMRNVNSRVYSPAGLSQNANRNTGRQVRVEASEVIAAAASSELAYYPQDQ